MQFNSQAKDERTSADLEHLIVVMPDAMPCPEYKRLRWEYEAAVRRWGDVLLAQHGARLASEVGKALEFRKDAADERDAAKGVWRTTNGAVRSVEKRSDNTEVLTRDLEVRQLG
jgi:hypothetical protein